MPKVMVDDWVWDMICEHYARLSDPTPDDQRVVRYMADKLGRQVARAAYMSQKRIDDITAVQELPQGNGYV